MPAKIVQIEGIGSVHLYKRKGSRSIRLGFSSNGEVRVSLPNWVPYQAGVTFAYDRSDWIAKHRPSSTREFAHGDKIGKAHRIVFKADTIVKTAQVRLQGTEIIIKYPAHIQASSEAVQKAAERGAKRALDSEAINLLPQRLKLLAEKYRFNFRSVEVKQLKSEWGSCNHRKEITLNYYLMQLPWHLIDYVLLHELVHTEHLNHGNDFWHRFSSVLPDAKKIRKELKVYKTAVVPL